MSRRVTAAHTDNTYTSDTLGGVTEVATPETPGTLVDGDHQPVDTQALVEQVAAIDKAIEEADVDDTVDDSPEALWLAAEKAWIEAWLAAEQEWIEGFTWFDPTEDWPHTWIEFRGDRLAVRTPKMSSLSAYSIATSEGSSNAQRNKYTRQLIERHMSPATYERVMDRFGDPDDEGYDEEALSGLMTEIVELTTGPTPKPNRAARRHPAT